MARVTLIGPLRELVGDVPQPMEITATTIRALLRVLVELSPSLEPHFAAGVAVAINGEIYQDVWLQPVPDDADVHILPALAGG